MDGKKRLIKGTTVKKVQRGSQFVSQDTPLLEQSMLAPAHAFAQAMMTCRNTRTEQCLCGG